MYERLLDKCTPPDNDFIKEYLGAESYNYLLQLEDFLKDHYDLKKELRFPFGNNYGWEYKYSHKSNHLCYAFLESGAFTVTLQLGNPCVSSVQTILPSLSEKAGQLWQGRYPCGEQGGWIHYRVTEKNDLGDIFELIKVKKKPIR
jgi:hypothetical protein